MFSIHSQHLSGRSAIHTIQKAHMHNNRTTKAMNFISKNWDEMFYLNDSGFIWTIHDKMQKYIKFVNQMTKIPFEMATDIHNNFLTIWY